MKPVSIEELAGILRKHSRFVLTSHVNPDGDALGSELAMAELLRSIGKSVAIVNHSPIPENFRWIDPDGFIETYDAPRHDTLIAEADALLVLDTNQPDRLRSMEPAVTSSKAEKVIIDHHLEPAQMADYVYADTEATSTGEIVHRIVEAVNPLALSKSMATALYAAIMTDTGSFRFPRTVGETYRIAGKLVDAGADPTAVYSNIYETWSPGRMRLLGEILDSMKTACGGMLAYVVCTREFLAHTGTTESDTDNFTVYPMSVDGVRAGMLFLELSDGVKISFRSKGAVPINKLANEFGGGGHLNAAGARLHGITLEEAIDKVLTAAPKYF